MEVFKPSDKFKRDFDKAANNAAREVHKLMKERQMKSIENAPKDIQRIFEEIWQEFLKTETNRFPYQVCGDFFLKGFDTAMATAGMRHSRRIAEMMQTDDKLIAISNDRQAFVWNENDMKWEPMPHLPQD